MTHEALVDLADKWLRKEKGCGFVATEPVTQIAEIPDAIGFRSDCSFLVECKVSRSDFLADKKKLVRINPKMGVGKFRYYLCPERLILSTDLPPMWGLLWVNHKMKIECIHDPYGRGNVYSKMEGLEFNKEAERSIMYSALRRMNRNKTTIETEQR